MAQVVEVIWRLRRNSQAKLKREAKRALTQSTGGLGTNNFVTIVERTDSPPLKNPWALSLPPPIRQHPSPKRSQPARASEEGRIESFTILYVTPDGFLPPLALALVRERQGSLLMAQGEDISHLKIGREVYLRQVGDRYLFTVKSHLMKVREAFKRLLRTIPSLPAKGKAAVKKETP